MITNVSYQPVNHDVSLKTKRVSAAFKHFALAIIKAPVALFRACLLAMRCKKGPFLENWSWKSVKAHCLQLKILCKKQAAPPLPLPLPLPLPKEDPAPIPILEQSIRPHPLKEKKDPDARLQRRVAKFSFMIPTEIGVNDSQFVMSAKNKKVGVFKISQGEGIWNPFSQKAYLNPGPMAQTASERAAYLFAKEFNNPHLTVPPVKIMELEGKKGSFAVYEKGTPADEIVHLFDTKETYTDEELYIFQIFVIFDYLLGNLDRKLENWLLDWVENEIRAIYPIDNANAFFTQKPEGLLGLNAAKHLYAWKNLRLATFAFTPAMRKDIEENVNDDLIQRIIKSINEDEQIRSCYPDGKFLSEPSRKDMECRGLKLRTLIQQNRGLTPKVLAEF